MQDDNETNGKKQKEISISDLTESATFRYLFGKLEMEEILGKPKMNGCNDLVQINNYMLSPVTARIIGPKGSQDHFAPGNVIVFSYNVPGESKLEITNFYYRILYEKSELINDIYKIANAMQEN